MKTNKNEIKIEALAASSPGGQHANRAETGVRATHTPTGISAVSRDTRSQIKNKEIALERLREKLRKYFSIPKTRKKTRPPKQANEKRLEEKKKRSEIKKLRKNIDNAKH